MLASNNIMSPATGRPIVTPSQDMVLGCYYLTAENPHQQKGAGRHFANLDDAIVAYEQQEVDLHAYVWVRLDPEEWDVEEEALEGKPKVETLADGTVSKTYPYSRVREDADGNVLSLYVYTTPGRIIFNKTIQEALAV
jgi:DNA-directed RNA polymerase subunit beta'